MELNELNMILEAAKGGDIVCLLMVIVGALILVSGLVALVISLWLSLRYHKFNKKENSCGLTGEQIARRILDENDLGHIAVTASGSFLFGNSYSHYFKKVRLRRLTWKKTSVSSLAMASEKSALAILDKEKDPDMVKRVRLVPLITFGPFAFIPMIVIGVVLDILITETIGIISVIVSLLGVAFYAFSLVLSVLTLKTEKKAQERALEITAANGTANDEEIADMRELFRLYNIEYINNIVLSTLELLFRVLQVVAKSKSGASASND
ncbi:MAG: zinc metallopeptidase [Clostridia bacterium]|nr:zinc metallopeptidase [Clostridia bacterium]